MKKVLLLFTICTLALTEATMAQSFYNFRRGRDIIASVGTGTTTYFGDLNDPGDYFDAKPNLSFGLQYFFTDRISGRAEVSWFRLQGIDAESEAKGKNDRNLSFRSDNFEVNAVGMINAFPNGNRFYQRQAINIYGFAGIGLLYFNPKAEVPETDWNGNALPDAGNYIALQPLQTEGVDYSRVALVIPFGLGVKLKAGPFFNISLEAGFRKTFTDYLDDVSTTYLPHTYSTDDEIRLREAMADKRHELDMAPLGLQEDHIRGNPSDKDAYVLYNLKIEFYLPQQIFSSSQMNRNRRHLRRGRGRNP